MKTIIYNQRGEEVGTTLLPKDIFELEMNMDLVHEVVVSQMSNRRTVIAHTKDRSEVRGGGRKPWRQKGTGRARHGSTRSPIWRGGGVTFGPTNERSFKKKINKKIRRKSLFIVLSEKRRKDLLIVLDKLELKEAKTKQLNQVIDNLRLKIETFDKGKILMVIPGIDKNLILAGRNLSNLGSIEVRNLNTLDLVSFKYIIILKDAIKELKEVFTSNDLNKEDIDIKKTKKKDLKDKSLSDK